METSKLILDNKTLLVGLDADIPFDLMNTIEYELHRWTEIVVFTNCIDKSDFNILKEIIGDRKVQLTITKDVYVPKQNNNGSTLVVYENMVPDMDYDIRSRVKGHKVVILAQHFYNLPRWLYGNVNKLYLSLPCSGDLRFIAFHYHLDREKLRKRYLELEEQDKLPMLIDFELPIMDLKKQYAINNIISNGFMEPTENGKPH